MSYETVENSWGIGGGAFGIAAVPGGVAGLGKRKRRKKAAKAAIPAATKKPRDTRPMWMRGKLRTRKPSAASAPTATIVQTPAGPMLATAPTVPATVAAGLPAQLAPVPTMTAGGSGSGFEAAFAQGVSAENEANEYAGAEPAQAASADDPMAFDDVAPEDEYNEFDGGADVTGMEGLGKGLFSKIGKALKKIAPIALPVAAGIVGGPIGAVGAQMLSAAASGGGKAPKGVKASSAAPATTVKDQFGNLLTKIGDVLLDSAGRAIADYSGGQWVSRTPAPVQGGSVPIVSQGPSGQQSIFSGTTGMIVVGLGALAVFGMSRRR
jgi:hypothetical protein